VLINQSFSLTKILLKIINKYSIVIKFDYNGIARETASDILEIQKEEKFPEIMSSDSNSPSDRVKACLLTTEAATIPNLTSYSIIIRSHLHHADSPSDRVKACLLTTEGK
ncbi:unnamed protein product, partial [Gordionus sp. m RMFG-2023]